MKSGHVKLEILRAGRQNLQLFQKLISLFRVSFGMKDPDNGSDRYLEGLLGQPGFIAYVALWEDEIAGGLTAYELPKYYSENKEVFIYDIAVKPGFQRKGVGKSLVLALQDYCVQNGVKEIFVAAHEEDKHALDFYQSIGGQPEKVVHFNFSIISDSKD